MNNMLKVEIDGIDVGVSCGNITLANIERIDELGDHYLAGYRLTLYSSMNIPVVMDGIMFANRTYHVEISDGNNKLSVDMTMEKLLIGVSDFTQRYDNVITLTGTVPNVLFRRMGVYV